MSGAPGPDGIRKVRLVVLQTHPIQYYAPLYAELAKRGLIDLHVVYLTDSGAQPYHDAQFGKQITWDIPLLEGYAHSFLQSGTGIQGRTFLQRNDPALTRVLKQLTPDWLLIYGYASWMNWRALLWAKRHRVRVAYSSDSNLRHQRAGMKQLAKYWVVRLFFKMIDAFFATSEANADYLAHFGVDKERISRIPFAIDVGRFQAGIPDLGARRPYDFIWAGKLIGMKRPGDFIAALVLVASRTTRKITAAIAGDGIMLDSIRDQASALPRNCLVEFLGFVNQQKMPSILQRADTLVFSSEGDAYGLIATEAAAAGLALIVAENNGCVGATVIARPGVNSRIYVSGDVEALAREMSGLLHDAEELHTLQAASRMIALEHTFPIVAGTIERRIGRAGAQ